MVDLIIIHCSATPEGRPVRMEDIDRWHRQRGWRFIGYHYVIELDGRIRRGRPETMMGAHCKGHNAHSLGICYVGGLDKEQRPKDTRTQAQRVALERLVLELLEKYPTARLAGHNQFAAKACPSFSVPEWATAAGIPETRIYR